MKHLTRREFARQLAATGATAAAAVALGPIVPAYGAATGRVIVVGGGFGGATCVNYLRRYAPQLAITLIQPGAQFVTCPFSNTVLGGINDIEFITFNYELLKSRSSCTVVNDWVTAVDPAASKVRLKSGATLPYDRLVLSPGIRFLWNTIEGHSEAASATLPHAWMGGAQTQILLKQLHDMPDGGVVVIAAPRKPCRAPPAALERASLIAYYLAQNKPKSKILLLDPNDGEPKVALFSAAWRDLYPGMIERVGGTAAEVTRVDVARRVVYTSGGDAHTGAVVNLIPQQRAAEIAGAAGLVDADGWCPVDQSTFESSRQKRIYVIGDACVAGDLPKTGFAANVEGKTCAAAVATSFNGGMVPPATYSTAFYSLVSPKYAISEAGVYRLTNGRIVAVADAVSDATAIKRVRLKEAEYAAAWYKSITSEMFAL
jgi:sulfide dehydrogenase [flavocytochrome c] flavoprotein subunit